MTVVFESGYTLPANDMPLENARILHSRNWRNPHTFNTSPGNADFPASSLQNPLTYEKWRPFTNFLPDVIDLSTDWTPTDVTVAGTNVIDEGTSTGFHSIQYAVTFAADDWVFGVIVDATDCPEFELHLFDGTTVSRRWFNLQDGTVGTGSGGATDATIRDLGNGQYMCRIVATAAAGTGFVKIQMGEGGESNNYTGENRTLRILETFVNEYQGFLTMRNLGAREADCFCIAGHNLGSRGATVLFLHDSNGDGSFTQIDSVTPTDDSPIMFIFEPITSADWRIRIDDGAMPEAAVVKVGKALQMERQINGNHRPEVYNRNTVSDTNRSETGETLGRTVQRTSLDASFSWNILTDDWVDANWPDLQLAVEKEPFFVAWRPLDRQEVALCDATDTPQVNYTGDSNFMTGLLRAEAVAWS